MRREPTWLIAALPRLGAAASVAMSFGACAGGEVDRPPAALPALPAGAAGASGGAGTAGIAGAAGKPAIAVNGTPCGRMEGYDPKSPWPQRGYGPKHCNATPFLGPKTPKVKWVHELLEEAPPGNFPSGIQGVLRDGSILCGGEAGLQVVSSAGETTLTFTPMGRFRDYFVSDALGGGFFARGAETFGGSYAVYGFPWGASAPAFHVPSGIGPTALDPAGNLVVITDGNVLTVGGDGSATNTPVSGFQNTAFVDDFLIVPTIRGDDDTWYVPGNESLRALDPVTGEVNWEVHGVNLGDVFGVPGFQDGTTNGALMMDPADLVYVERRPTNTTGGTLALHPNDGSVAWTAPGVGPLAVAPDGTLVVVGKNGLAGVDVNGNVLWTSPYGGYGTVMGGDGTMYSLTRDKSNYWWTIVAVSRTGDLLWQTGVLGFGTGYWAHDVHDMVIGTDNTLYVYIGASWAPMMSMDYHEHWGILAIGP